MSMEMSEPRPGNTAAPSPTPDKSDAENLSITGKGSDAAAGQGFPDGGWRAWLVAAGTAGALFCTMGYSNTFGIFEAWYLYHQLPNHSADAIAWIGSIQAFLIFATGVVAGPLFDRYGTWVIRPAAVVYLFAIMMTSICSEYWHFMLAQGILTGVSNGFIMVPAMSSVSQWFDKRRGAAMGIAIAGSSLGAVIFPVALSSLLTRVGFGWAVRITGFIMMPVLLFVCVAVRARLPPRKTGFFIWAAFRNPMYDVLILALFCGLVGMFVPLFLIPTYAISRGMNASLASYLVAIVNAASIFGRVIPGVLGDKFGRFNTLFAACLSTGIMVFCWPLAKSNAAIIVFSGFFGLSSGAIVSGAAVAVSICADEPKNMGTYMGVGMALASLGSLVGPPVSGVMVDKYGGFEEVSYFAGALTLTGSVLVGVAKALSSEGLFGRF